MAKLFVTEFAHSDSEYGSRVQAPRMPPLRTQTLDIGGGSISSLALNTRTRLIRLHCDAICSITCDTSGVAAATDSRFAANQTEYWAVAERDDSQTPFKVAVITNS